MPEAEYKAKLKEVELKPVEGSTGGSPHK